MLPNPMVNYKNCHDERGGIWIFKTESWKTKVLKAFLLIFIKEAIVWFYVAMSRATRKQRELYVSLWNQRELYVSLCIHYISFLCPNIYINLHGIKFCFNILHVTKKNISRQSQKQRQSLRQNDKKRQCYVISKICVAFIYKVIICGIYSGIRKH